MDSLPARSSPAYKKRRRHRSTRFWTRLAALWREWWVEVLIVCLGALAVFLLVERVNLRAALQAGLLSLAEGARGLAASSSAALAAASRRITISDGIAYLLLLAVTALLAWRLRSRLLSSPSLAEIQCPRCAGELRLVHRRWLDRLASLFVPLRRYRCRNRECRWSGLRTHPRG